MKKFFRYIKEIILYPVTGKKLNGKTVVAFGIFNSGKSLFLNCLLGNIDAENRIKDSPNNIMHYLTGKLIDTPGIDVSAQDEEYALEAIKHGDIFILVHNPNTGELVPEEVNLLKSADNMFEEGYFLERFICILPFSAGLSDLEKKQVGDKISSQFNHIFNHLPDLIYIDSKTYLKGLLNKKKPLINASGIKAAWKVISKISNVASRRLC